MNLKSSKEIICTIQTKFDSWYNFRLRVCKIWMDAIKKKMQK